MTFAEIQAYFLSFHPQAFPDFIDETSELPLYLRMVNNQIAAYPHKFSWLLREYSLTLTGASSYNLGTLIPDLAQVYKPYGTGFAGNEPRYQSLADFNINVGGNTITMQGKTLKIQGSISSGTLVIPYYSNYLVVDTLGVTRKMNFTATTDISLVPDEHIPMLIEGVEEYIARKDKQSSYTRAYQLADGRIANVTPFLFLIQQAALTDIPMSVIVRDWRFGT